MNKSILAKYMGNNPATNDELEAMRRRAWIEQGVLMISPSDPMLTDDEKNKLLMLAEARYGYGGAR